MAMNASSSGGALRAAGDALIRVGALPGLLASWLVLIITIAVLVSVIGNMYRMGTFVSWGADLPVLGRELTMTGVSELQWHLFAVMVMLGGAYALAEDRHVRVDLVYAGLSERGRATVDILGDLLFLLPFMGFTFWLSLNFVGMAYRSGEASDYGGLVDRYLVKSIIPIGCALLCVVGLGRILRNLGRLIGPTSQQPR
jgi:TRAP-type mannitol/chloroaromatic compound transport system permease small subunit